MRRERIRVAFCATLPLVVTALVPVQATGVQNIRAGNIAAGSGEKRVVVPVLADTDERLTLLSVDLSFDPALCGAIENETLAKAGRTIANVQEGGLRCPAQGRVRIVLLNLTGGTAIPVGTGVIVEWAFDVRAGAADRIYPILVTVNQARNGPLTVELAASDGELRIGPQATQAPTGTATAIPTSTSIPSQTVTPSQTATSTAIPTSTSTPSPMVIPSQTATSTATPTESPTVTPSQTATSTATATATRTATPTHTPEASPSQSVTPADTPPSAPCPGDCDQNGAVSIDEALEAVGIALGIGEVRDCSASDRDSDGRVIISELVAMVRAALSGCEPSLVLRAAPLPQDPQSGRVQRCVRRCRISGGPARQTLREPH